MLHVLNDEVLQWRVVSEYAEYIRYQSQLCSTFASIRNEYDDAPPAGSLPSLRTCSRSINSVAYIRL